MEKERELRRKHASMNKNVAFGGLAVWGRKAWKVLSEPKKGVRGADAQEEEILATARGT